MRGNIPLFFIQKLIVKSSDDIHTNSIKNGIIYFIICMEKFMKKKDNIIYIITVIFSALYIVFGNKFATANRVDYGTAESACDTGDRPGI